MKKSDVLQRIKLSDYPECDYIGAKDFYFSYFNRFLKQKCTIPQCVNGTYYYHFEEEMNENGMEKLCLMIAGMLFMMEHNEVKPDQAYGTKWDVLDFETGDYDDLFTPEDLKLIKADIKVINAYLATRPELIEGVEKERQLAQKS